MSHTDTFQWLQNAENPTHPPGGHALKDCASITFGARDCYSNLMKSWLFLASSTSLYKMLLLKCHMLRIIYFIHKSFWIVKALAKSQNSSMTTLIKLNSIPVFNLPLRKGREQQEIIHFLKRMERWSKSQRMLKLLKGDKKQLHTLPCMAITQQMLHVTQEQQSCISTEQLHAVPCSIGKVNLEAPAGFFSSYHAFNCGTRMTKLVKTVFRTGCL